MAKNKKQKPFGSLIETISQLKELSQKKDLECFITLNGGGRSSKDIRYVKESNNFHIYHHIDGESELLSEQQLLNSFVGMALQGKALFKYN